MNIFIQFWFIYRKKHEFLLKHFKHNDTGIHVLYGTTLENTSANLMK